MIWDRIEVGTLALFGSENEVFATARVIGKGLSEAASVALWGVPDFRWLIILTSVERVAIPLSAVRGGAGFAPTYSLNRRGFGTTSSP